jgi:hypothetical protein
MPADWLTDRIEHLVVRLASTMPAERREWGEAVVAEFAAIPPGERRLRWAVGALWFVLRRPGALPATPPPVGWASRLFAAVGVLSVLPWALFSILGLAETDAPDATMRSLAGMLIAQTVLIAAFVASCRPWRPAPATLAASILGYAAAAALSAADNDGYPLLAALIFAVPPAMAATPIVLIRLWRRHTQP